MRKAYLLAGPTGWNGLAPSRLTLMTTLLRPARGYHRNCIAGEGA